MSLFRISEHVPDVYPRKSRDFQLFCAVFDIVFGYLKYNIDSIRNITDTEYCNQKLIQYSVSEYCNQKLIPLLQTKLGFYSDISIPSEDLRLILKAFPFLVKNKGSLTGITGALRIFLKVIGSDAEYEVKVINKVYSSDGKYLEDENYIINIATSEVLTNTDVLDQILKYVVPAGYIVKYTYKNTSDTITKIDYSDKTRIHIVPKDSADNSSVCIVGTDDESKLTKRVDTATIAPIKVVDLFGQGE